MISINKIKTVNAEYYNFTEELLTSAFPKEERRELALQRDYTDNNPLFFNNIILDNDTPVGFITYWKFEDYYYIEHFAIHPSQRNEGYGKKVLEHLHKTLNAPIVLEVELPNDEMSIRRIGFYERVNYKLWENEYSQPPYRKGDDYLPMHLMVYGDLDSEKDFDRIKHNLYKEVYLVEDI